MSDAPVREVRTVKDMHGTPVKIGVDHDAVTIGGFTFGPDDLDDFMRVVFDADQAAHWWAATQADEDELPAADDAA